MKLKEHRKILKEVADMSSQGIQISDSKGKIFIYNRAMESLENTDRHRILGKTVDAASEKFGKNKDRIKRAMQRKIGEKNSIVKYKDANGNEREIVISTQPVIVEEKVVAVIEIAETAQPASRGEKIKDRPMNAFDKFKDAYEEYFFENIVANDDFMKIQVSLAKKAANSDNSVIIYGDVGTGKRFFAKSIHFNSKKKNHPFISQSCKGIREERIDEIIFGSRKEKAGIKVHRGILEEARGGTVLLDGIENLSHEIQDKLLKSVQEKFIKRIGGDEIIPIDARIIGTINDEPQDLIAKGMLKKELFYALSTIVIELPKLRERKDDIMDLTKVFLHRECNRLGRKVPKISEKAEIKLQNYNYPANVRELEKTIFSAVASKGRKGYIDEDDIMFKEIGNKEYSETVGYNSHAGTLDEFIKGVEKKIIIEVLEKNGGNISKTAEELGMKRQTLQHKIKKYSYNYRG